MALQTTTLQGILRGPDGVALAGATLRFVLSHTAADVGSNTALVRTPVDVVSGNDGSVSVDLWPNANGFENTHYDVRAYANDENGKAVTYEFGKLQVPDAGPADLAELLGAGVLRAQGVEGQVLDAAVRAETAAQASRLDADRAAATADALDLPAVEANLRNALAGSFPVTPNLMKDTRNFDAICGGVKGVEQDLLTAVAAPWNAEFRDGAPVASAKVVAYADFAAEGIPTGGELAEMEGASPANTAFCALVLDAAIPAGGAFVKLGQRYAPGLGKGAGAHKSQTSIFAAVLEGNGATELEFGINHATANIGLADTGQGWLHHTDVDVEGYRWSEFWARIHNEGRIKVALALPYLGLGDHGGAKIWAGSVGFYHTEDQLLAGS